MVSRAYNIIRSCNNKPEALPVKAVGGQQAGILNEDDGEVKTDGGCDKVESLPADSGVEKRGKSKYNGEEGEPVELAEARRLASI